MIERTDSDLDGYAVVAGHWPLAGPHSPIRTAYAAQALTALVRYLNAAVNNSDGVATAADAARVETAAREALAGLPEVATAAERRKANMQTG